MKLEGWRESQFVQLWISPGKFVEMKTDEPAPCLIHPWFLANTILVDESGSLGSHFNFGVHIIGLNIDSRSGGRGRKGVRMWQKMLC